MMPIVFEVAPYIFGKFVVKVKVTLKEPTKAQKGSRGIALFFP